MKIFELKTKNGREFRVAIANSNQQNRLNKVIENNKSKGYEIFTSIKCIKNGIHNIKSFEALADSLT